MYNLISYTVYACMIIILIEKPRTIYVYVFSL